MGSHGVVVRIGIHTSGNTKVDDLNFGQGQALAGR